MKYIFSALCIILMTGCLKGGKKEVRLEGCWRLNDVSSKNAASSFDAEAEARQAVSAGAMLNLFEDGSYTYISSDSNYLSGKWNAKDKAGHIVFLPSTKTSEDLKFTLKSAPPRLPELVLINERTGEELKYSKEAEPTAKAEDDPYHYSNNFWRIKPAKPEMKNELKERLMNYIRHFALILRSATERKQHVVYFGFSQGPIQVYSGGIGVVPYYDVPDAWKNTYYNEEDAVIAYYLYKKAVIQNNYRGASVGNWFEDDYKILQSLYTQVKQMND